MPYADSLKFTLQWEGGYVNDPADPGGATNCGITQAVYDSWRAQHKQAKQPVRQATAGEVEAIYRARYWDACACGQLPAPVDMVVFDSAVNCGTRRAVLWLQRALGVAEDGQLGPKTVAAARESAPFSVADRICRYRAEHYHDIVTRRPSLAKFAKGWANRLSALEKKVAP